MTTFLDSGTVVNPVTSILLGYRVFDTVFEALMLLVAVLGVVHLIEPRPREEARGFAGIAAGHPTMVTAVKVLTPVLIVVAAALIIGDPNTPGGGFQGAGLLAAVVVSRYLIRPVARSRAHNMETLEKVIYAVFVVSVALYLFVGLRHDIPFYTYTWFMLLMNGLLGLKVFCGLTIMFLYFTGEDDSEETAAVANATHTPEVPPHG
jgi:multicomponent Na+:H+ antiporter subunit B